ncbi:uncharacterized protein LOC127718301 isoform X2 [Mytilus californianus]|nr:uncharacterized protein LOC127718301 isoform X2 [Mytilus californianus]
MECLFMRVMWIFICMNDCLLYADTVVYGDISIERIDTTSFRLHADIYKPIIGKSVNVLVNHRTIGVVRLYDNKCYTKNMECTGNSCSCTSTDGVFSLDYVYHHLNCSKSCTLGVDMLVKKDNGGQQKVTLIKFFNGKGFGNLDTSIDDELTDPVEKRENILIPDICSENGYTPLTLTYTLVTTISIVIVVTAATTGFILVQSIKIRNKKYTKLEGLNYDDISNECSEETSALVSAPFITEKIISMTDNTELRLVIIGRAGTGKSATGNKILGKPEFNSKVSGSCITTKCKVGTNNRFNRNITIVDTPPIFDTGMNNEHMSKEVAKIIRMTVPGPHAFLLTLQIGVFTKEELNSINNCLAHFGDDFFKYVVVIFTRADDLDDENIDIRDYVKNCPPSLKKILKRCENRYIPFNNKLSGQSHDEQVINLLRTVDLFKSCYTIDKYNTAQTLRQESEKEENTKFTVEEMVLYRQIKSYQKYTLVIKENKKMTEIIEQLKTKKLIVESRLAENKKRIASLQNELKVFTFEKSKDSTHLVDRVVNKLRDVEVKHEKLLQTQVNEALDYIITLLQKQIENDERRKVKQIDNLKREQIRKVREVKENSNRRTRASKWRYGCRKKYENEDSFLDMYSEVDDSAQIV